MENDIDQAVKDLHDNAEREIDKLKAEQEELRPIKEDKKEPMSFKNWYTKYNIHQEFATMSKRRGTMMPSLVTAYTNLDILKCVDQIAKNMAQLIDITTDLSVELIEMNKQLKEGFESLADIKNINNEEETKSKRSRKKD